MFILVVATFPTRILLIALLDFLYCYLFLFGYYLMYPMSFVFYANYICFDNFSLFIICSFYAYFLSICSYKFF